MLISITQDDYPNIGVETTGNFSLKDKGRIRITGLRKTYRYYLYCSEKDSHINIKNEGTLLLSSPDITIGETYLFDLSSISNDILKNTKAFYIFNSFYYDNGSGYLDDCRIRVDYNEPASKVVPLEPSGVTLDGSKPITFKWEHVSSTGDPPYGYELEYSTDRYDWKSIHSVSSVGNLSPVATQYTTSNLNFGNNIIYWRVRTYNTCDIPGDWGSLSFISRAPAQPPTISSISNTPKIKMLWVSDEQIAFQIIANQYDSKTVFGTDKYFEIPVYFKDGESVSVKIRIKNKLGDWSEWTEKELLISNSVLPEITLNAQSENESAKLTWSTEHPYTGYYILRDGIPIAKITGSKEYADYTSIGTNEYQIMGITSDGYYTLSNVVPVSVLPQTAVIGILLNAVSWINLTYRRGNLPEIVTSSSEDVYYQYYSGRKLPVAYSSRFKTKTKTLNFTVYKHDADAIENMIGQTVIYKDYAENKIIGIVNDVETSSNASRPDVRLEITAIDYLEDVGYD